MNNWVVKRIVAVWNNFVFGSILPDLFWFEDGWKMRAERYRSSFNLSLVQQFCCCCCCCCCCWWCCFVSVFPLLFFILPASPRDIQETGGRGEGGGNKSSCSWFFFFPSFFFFLFYLFNERARLLKLPLLCLDTGGTNKPILWLFHHLELLFLLLLLTYWMMQERVLLEVVFHRQQPRLKVDDATYLWPVGLALPASNLHRTSVGVWNIQMTFKGHGDDNKDRGDEAFRIHMIAFYLFTASSLFLSLFLSFSPFFLSFSHSSLTVSLSFHSGRDKLVAVRYD